MVTSARATPLSELSHLDLNKLAFLIEQNETGGREAYLTYWSPNEAFPSFGIGHFIWLPPGSEAPFSPSFLSMVRFVDRHHPAPEWLQAASPSFPWRDRADFYQAWSSEPLQTLRHWLSQTKPIQAAFIVKRFQSQLTMRLSELPPARSQRLRQRVRVYIQFESGLLALLDYANFKGIGANARERYQGQGWGLLDVLEAMPIQAFLSSRSQRQQLVMFVKQAKIILKKRTELAPVQRNETRWLKGWYQRLDRYKSWGEAGV
jgi:hypothetical protein